MVHKPSPSKLESSLHFTVNLFRCMVLITALASLSVLASSALADSKTASVNVSVLEDRTDRTVIHYDFGDFSQQQVTIENETYNAIFLKGESNKKEVGAPALPDVSRSIIIADDALVEVNVLDSSYYEIEDFDIVPSKGYISREINPADVPYTFGNVYQSEAFYPGPLAQLGKPYIMRDHRGVVVTVNPFQYNPVQRLLRVYTQMTVEVTAAGLGKINVLQRDVRKRKLSRAFHTIYSAHFINYTPDERQAALDEEGELLIIVHDAWNSNVQPLKTHKDSIGINTTIQNVSTIPGGGNLDTAIKAYIQGIYDDSTRDLAFVSLVGDLAHVDSFTAVTYVNGESDPKYSKLAGSDDYPDIIVGRLSAETAADVDTQVARIIEYETMPTRSQSWFWQGTGIASDDGSGNGDDSEWDWEHMRNIRTDMLTYGYTQVDELYEGSQGGGDAAGNPTDTMVLTSVNAGRGIMNYCGHGDVISWGTTGFNNADVNALINDNMLPFIFDVACLNGNFGETTCFAEAWMRATNGSEPTGAIGIYASSINQPWSPPMEAQDEFNLLYVADSYNAYGAYCYAAACSMMDDYPGDGETYGNGHATFNTWHIFGDPTLRIRPTATEKALKWLRNNQEANGSWQSHVGYTAMATLAFLNAGYTENDEVVSDGIQYLLSNVQPDGGIYGIYNWYGNYETSLSILALKATGNTDYDDEIANAANYLKSIQSDDSDDPDHSWYGGWGYDASCKNNWSDLSNSQFSAMALDAAAVPKGDPVWTRFLSYLSRVQNLDDINDMPWADGRTDGGFTYSPHYNIWNNFNSYGSMTSAGIWGLRLSGVEVADDRVQAALGWLELYEDLNFNSNPMWGDTNRYYYYMAFAKAMAMCFLSQDDTGTWYESWYDRLKEKIVSEQHSDGYWNQSQGMWVDTFWALLTLQTQQPLPANLWMSIILASPADLVVYDPQDRVCSEDECNIPGATFEVDDDENQVVNLTKLEPGHYRFVFHGTGNGTCHLTVNGHRDDEIISTDSIDFEIRNGEVLESNVLVSSLVGALTINVEDPAPPPFIPVTIDFCPEECPNTLDVRSKGKAPLAMLGTEVFDVTHIDPDSVYLEGVYRERYNYEDVTGPHECDCGFDCESPDGNVDMTLKFDRKQIIPVIGEVNDGDVIELTLTGNLKSEFGGTLIRGTDTIIIEKE